MDIIWASSWDYGTYHTGDQRRLRQACAVSPEPSLFAYIKYGSRRRVRLKVRLLAPLDGCTGAFKEWVCGRRKNHNLMRWLLYVFCWFWQNSACLTDLNKIIWKDRDPLEIQYPKFENSRLGLIVCSWEIIADVMSLMPPCSWLSKILCCTKDKECKEGCSCRTIQPRHDYRKLLLVLLPSACQWQM